MGDSAGTADTSDEEDVRAWGEIVEKGVIINSVEGAGIIPVGLMVI